MGSCFDYNSYTLLVLDCATMSGSQIVDESQNLERTWLMLFPFFLILGERKETTKAIWFAETHKIS